MCVTGLIFGQCREILGNELGSDKAPRNVKKMKVIVLAAGYGTRLQRDIQNDPEQSFKQLLGVPKPLVPVGGECVISRWMVILRKMYGVGGVTEVFLVVGFYTS